MPTTEQMTPRSKRKALQAAVKRMIDVIGSLMLIVLLLPAFVAIAILVKLHDGGTIIFRRRVVGLKGEFDAFKFRSMCPDADARLHSDPALLAEFQKNYKLVDDPRITGIGRVLRKTSMDELPQLFNVLFGQMSLIGPRSITTKELEKYGDARELLLTVKPGLSGYWQTEGRSRVSYEERVKMDVFYIQNWSLSWDIRILFKTPYAVVKGDGAH